MGAYDFLLNGAQGVQLPDQVAQAQKFMSLASIANQNKLQEYTLQAAQRKDAAATGMGQALGGLDVNDDAAVARAVQSAPPEARQMIVEHVMKMRKEGAEAGFKKAETGAKDWEVKKGQAAVIGNLANYLANKPDVNQQDVMAAAANVKALGLDPSQIIPPPGQDPRAHWQALAGQAMDAVKQMELQGQAAGRQETNRHNTTEEQLTGSRDANTASYQRGELGVRNAELQNSNMRARAAMVTADPFGLSGLNTGAGGAPSAPAGPQLPQGVNPADAGLFKAAVADAAKNGQPTFKIGAQGPFNVADYQGGQQPAAAPAGGSGGIQGAMQSGLHGEEFLQSLPSGVASLVKAIAEGKQPPAQGAALRSPQVQQLIMLAAQYDPSFDATAWGARASMAKDWGDQGAIGKSNLAINTVIGHLGDLKKSADAMNNTSITPLNAVVNKAESLMGDPRYKTFEANAGAVAKELERAYRGTGGSQSDIDAMKSELSSSGSPQQLTGVIQKYVELLQSKIEANADAYKKTMGRDPPPLLSDKAQKTRDTIAGGGDKQAILMQARDAISKGADPAKVRERLQQMGVTDSP
jgi:hypothetical protein